MYGAFGSPWAFSVIPFVFNIRRVGRQGSRCAAGTLSEPDVYVRSAFRGRAGAQDRLLLTREPSSHETGRFGKQPNQGRDPRATEPIATPKPRNREDRSRSPRSSGRCRRTTSTSP